MEEFGHKHKKIFAYCHSQNTFNITRYPTFHSKTKCLGVQYHFIKEVVEGGSVDMQKIYIKDNLTGVKKKLINLDKTYMVSIILRPIKNILNKKLAR